MDATTSKQERGSMSELTIDEVNQRNANAYEDTYSKGGFLDQVKSLEAENAQLKEALEQAEEALKTCTYSELYGRDHNGAKVKAALSTIAALGKENEST